MHEQNISLRWVRGALGALTLISLLALAGAAIASDLQVGRTDNGKLATPIFSNHMVLQRHHPIPIFGEGSTGSTVALELLDPSNGFVLASTSTNVEAGVWRVDLPPLSAGGPFELRISDSLGSTITIEDILVGEVWIASGQSNISPSRFTAESSWNEDFRDAELPLDLPWVRSFANSDQRKGEGWGSVPGETAAWLAVTLAAALETVEVGPVPVGIVNLGVGGSSIRRWAGDPEFLDHEDGEKMGDHYQSWIQPIAPFAARGVFWWQGESDHQGAGSAHYADRLSDLITTWRAAFENDELYFATVLIPTGRGVSGDQVVKPQPRKIPDARAAGRMYSAYLDAEREIPEVGVALTKDLVGGTHPSDRESYAKRLVDLVRHDVYGENFSFTGPLFSCVERESGGFRVHFAPGTAEGLRAGGLMKDGTPATELQGFQIGTNSSGSTWATLRIDGDTVLVTAAEIVDPTYVNYAWKGNPRWANLFNAAGLGAGPFEANWPEDACSPD